MIWNANIYFSFSPIPTIQRAKVYIKAWVYFISGTHTVFFVLNTDGLQTSNNIGLYFLYTNNNKPRDRYIKQKSPKPLLYSNLAKYQLP